MRGSLCGYVVRHDGGLPVAEALVEAVTGEAVEPRTVSTDRAGWFAIDGLPPGQWLLHAWAPDNEQGHASAPVYPDAFSDVTIRIGGPPDPRLPAGSDSVFKAWVKRMQHGSVDGRVVRAGRGEPVEDAAVTVVRGAGAVPDIAPLTNSAGKFRLDGLPPGDWVFGAMGPGGERGQAAVRVLSGHVVAVTIEVRS